MRNKVELALTFAVYVDDDLLRRQTITEPIIKLGRDTTSHLAVADESVARMHAVIEVSGASAITLIDLGNSAGTLVNGARVNKCKLAAGDVIELGTTRIVLETVEHPAAARIAAAVPYEPVGSIAAAPTAPALSNPFLAPAAFASPFGRPLGVREDADEGSYEYQICTQAPSPPKEETETDANAVEVRVLWGRNVLEVRHQKPRKSFFIGSQTGKKQHCDFPVPSAKLGAERAALVLGGEAAEVVLLPGATGTITCSEAKAVSSADAIASGLATPSSAGPSGGHKVRLVTGMVVRQQVGDLIFEVSGVKQGRKSAAAFTLAALASGALAYVIGSFVGHAGLLAALAVFMPPLNTTGDDTPTDEQRYLIGQYLENAANREQEERETEQLTDANADGDEGGTGERAKNEEGKMGSPTSKATNKRFAIKGNSPNPRMSRVEALRMASEFGTIGLLNNMSGGDPGAPTAPWAGLVSEGQDPMSAQGNMWGDELGEAGGVAGLGLTGIGEGGGGRGEGIGLGTVGTIGHGSGYGTNQGFGNGHGRLSGARHKVRAPRVRIGPTSVSGRLPPEVIQRIVRANYGRFRSCYQTALRNNPNLQGRVSVRFVIGRDGRVSNVGGSGDIPDSGVVSCVTRSFYSLSFPQPDGGIVTVGYPIVFSPAS